MELNEDRAGVPRDRVPCRGRNYIAGEPLRNSATTTTNIRYSLTQTLVTGINNKLDENSNEALRQADYSVRLAQRCWAEQKVMGQRYRHRGQACGHQTWVKRSIVPIFIDHSALDRMLIEAEQLIFAMRDNATQYANRAINRCRDACPGR